MARMVLHTQKQPYIIQIGNETKAICACGLSTTKPYCNGNHHKTTDEEEGKVYRYNVDLSREEISE